MIGEEFYLTSDCTGLATPCALNDNPPKSFPGGHPAVEYVPALITPNAGSNVCPPVRAQRTMSKVLNVPI